MRVLDTSSCELIEKWICLSEKSRCGLKCLPVHILNVISSKESYKLTASKLIMEIIEWFPTFWDWDSEWSSKMGSCKLKAWCEMGYDTSVHGERCQNWGARCRCGTWWSKKSFPTLSPNIIKAYQWICSFTFCKANPATHLWEKVQNHEVGQTYCLFIFPVIPTQSLYSGLWYLGWVLHAQFGSSSTNKCKVSLSALGIFISCPFLLYCSSVQWLRSIIAVL